jgi:PAS domain S-box-containing protein
MTAESWPDIWKQLKKSGKNQHETFYRHKDGTFFPVEVINNYIAVNGQELCFSFINDITERKKIKQALRDANAFSVGILDSLTAHIAVLDEQGVIIAVNRAWKQFGKDNDLLESSHDTLGANYLDICKNAFNQSSGEEAKLVEAGIKSVLTGERETFHLKYPCHSTLQQRWFYMNVSPLQGSGRGVVVSHEDITERKLAQLKLQDKEQMLSESQRITHIGSWSIDLATGYISWSDEMYHIYGVTEETFDHTLAGFISLIHPDDRVAMQQWCNACLTGYASEDLDFRIVWPDGTIRLIRGSGGLQYDDMNRPFRAIGSAQDITERKERDQRDKEHLDQLAHITRLGLMGDMASGIVHEVNQPLTAIINYSQASLNFLKTENYDRVKLAETIQKVQQQASRTSEIIQKMREFIKSNAMQSLKADVNDLIKTVSILCAAQLKDNQINLVLELEKNLPLIDVDHIQIEQVIINLFRNSADALQSLPETIQRQLTVHSQLTPENELQISVKDNGPGLSAEQQEKLMTPFYTTKADGMGIGLSISRSIIEAHNGRLHFESLLGVGTVFYITLPI